MGDNARVLAHALASGASKGGPITSVTRLDHAGITVPFLGEKRPQVSVRVTPGSL